MLSFPENALVEIACEGGIAFFPGLAAPRKLALSVLGAEELTRLCITLSECASTPQDPVGQGDQRYFHIRLLSPNPTDAPLFDLKINELHTPNIIKDLWAKAPRQ